MRPTVAHWTCRRSGDCCVQTRDLVMTHAERAELERVTSLPLQWKPHAVARFVRLVSPTGCPFVTFTPQGEAACSVYEVRPYNCRRFGCYRPDPLTEPYEAGGPLGCRNLSDRVETSLTVYTSYAALQRHAQPWARAHGWSKGMNA